MKALFDFVLDLLDNWPTFPMAEEDEYGIYACALSLAVLTEMIDCRTSNMVNDNFSLVIERFGDHVQAAHCSSNEFSKLQAQKHMQYLRLRLGVGDALAETQANMTVTGTRAEFVMLKGLPGQYLAEGPRHDNDHADICKIRILRTPEEIESVRNDYLLTTNPSLFHISRICQEFRLLREDTVGQLRDAARIQLDHIRDPGRNQDRGGRNLPRTYTYEQAMVVDIDFGRKRGIDLLMNSASPHPRGPLCSDKIGGQIRSASNLVALFVLFLGMVLCCSTWLLRVRS